MLAFLYASLPSALSYPEDVRIVPRLSAGLHALALALALSGTTLSRSPAVDHFNATLLLKAKKPAVDPQGELNWHAFVEPHSWIFASQRSNCISGRKKEGKTRVCHQAQHLLDA
ncbi:hypothetical protein CIRG_05956 [Coccidioides immitis RMSCC 2394]|uniref:Uncharacterized protein n=1 Tax=Coccidioides immitis RMSCC 2394 TaxID=404692 RepID=A0A0J6YF11_COCIT|nr:hypothetical protein CIRG_05956 [Coccidioides immitis RMSCC 2394]